MKEMIRQRARELGFDDCRVTTADPPRSAPQFEHWLIEGQHGEMTYLARNAHKRVEPRKVLPEARSIITLAASYAQSLWEKAEARTMESKPGAAFTKQQEIRISKSETRNKSEM